VSASDKTASRQLASGPGQRPGTRLADITAGWPGVRQARRAAQWGNKKYAGSLAEDVWRRLDAIDFINRGMVFAATLLLSLFPFLIVVSALAGRSAARSLTRSTGLNSQAAADIGHLFASPAATTSAVVGTASMVAGGQDLPAGSVLRRLRHRRAVRGHADGLLAGLLRHGGLRRAHLRPDRDHLRPTVLPDRRRRGGYPRRGRRPRLARALTRHEGVRRAGWPSAARQ